MKRIFGLSVSLLFVTACAGTSDSFRRYDTFGEAPAAVQDAQKFADNAESIKNQVGSTAQEAESVAAQAELYGEKAGGGRAPASVNDNGNAKSKGKKKKKFQAPATNSAQ